MFENHRCTGAGKTKRVSAECFVCSFELRCFMEMHQ